MLSPFAMGEVFFTTVSAQDQAKEKAKARELRGSQWWKQQLGKGICYYCLQKFPREQLTMDHIIPIARGGKSTKKNVVVACKECNSKKKYYTPGELALMDLGDKE